MQTAEHAAYFLHGGTIARWVASPEDLAVSSGSAIAEHYLTVNKSSLCVSTYGCLLRVKSPPHNAFSPFFNFRMLKDYSAADDK